MRTHSILIASVAALSLAGCGVEDTSDHASEVEVSEYRLTNCPAPFQVGDFVRIKLSGEKGQVISPGYSERSYHISGKLAGSACETAPFQVRFFTEELPIEAGASYDRYPVKGFQPVELELVSND